MQEEFTSSRQRRLEAVGFPRYLEEFVESHTQGDSPLRFALLAHLTRVDLELAIHRKQERRAIDYLEAFPELNACPIVVVDLLRMDAFLRSDYNLIKAWRLIQSWPLRFRRIFEYYNSQNRFEIKGSIEEGGQGVVYHAEDVELCREVAVKRPRFQDESSVRSLLEEARLTASLEHPVITPVYGVVHSGEHGFFYAMQFAKLDRLDKSIAEYHRSTKKELGEKDPLWRMVTQLIAVARAIHYAHYKKKGVLHLDIKPSNILVGSYGETMLIDWGVARSVASPPGAAVKTGGTPPYMSPEQANAVLRDCEKAALDIPDSIERPADIYSLGATLYHILANRPPYLAKSGESPEALLRRIVDAPPPTLAEVAPQADRTLAAIAAKAMRREPTDRYSSAEAFARELELWQAGKETFALPWSRSEKAWKWLHTHLKVVVVGGLGIALAVALLVGMKNWLELRHRREVLAKTVAQLAKLPATEVRSALNEIRESPAEWTLAELNAVQNGEAESSSNHSPQHSPRIDLAMLPFEPSRLTRLLGQMADVAEPSEYSLIAHETRQFLERASRKSADGGADRSNSSETAISDVDPHRPLAIASLAEPHQKAFNDGVAKLKERLTRVQGELGVTPLVRVRAAAALETFEPQRQQGRLNDTGPVLAAAALEKSEIDRVWSTKELVDDLVRLDARWFDELLARLTQSETLTCEISKELKRRFEASETPSAERTAAAMCLVRLPRRERGAMWISELLGRAEPEQLPIFVESARRLAEPDRARLVEQLRHALEQYQERAEKPCVSESDQLDLDRLAATTANLALVVWVLEPHNFLKAADERDGTEVDFQNLLERSRDPRLRTELIQRFHASGYPLGNLFDRAIETKSPAAAAALLLTATTYPVSELSPESLKCHLATLLQRAEIVGDPEVVAALEKLASKWNQDLPRITPPVSRVNQIGWMETTGHNAARNHRMVIIPAALADQEFEIGAASGEGFRDVDERLMRARIPREFAVGDREVTVEQFREFLNAFAAKGEDEANDAKREMDELVGAQSGPRKLEDKDAVCNLSMGVAAAYCNWLSDQEKLERCYPDDVDQYIGAIDTPGPLWHTKGMLQRTGYRLPTEVEAEFVYRAGTRTPRSYGYRKTYIGRYAVFRFDDQLGPSEPATRLPNPWGLFDTLGNVAEWCHPRPQLDEGMGDQVFVDQGPILPWNGPDPDDETSQLSSGAILRGGAHNNVVDVLRSAYRLPQPWTVRSMDVGFRLVRTLYRQTSPKPSQPEK